MTTAPANLQVDQSARIKRYLFTMGVRTASFILAFFTEGWVRWTFVVLAVFLPYFAVVAANAVAPRAFGRMQRDPGPSSNFHIPQ